MCRVEAGWVQRYGSDGYEAEESLVGQRRVTTNEKGNVSFSFSPNRPVRAGATINGHRYGAGR
jgi:hypothetical protein